MNENYINNELTKKNIKLKKILNWFWFSHLKNKKYIPFDSFFNKQTKNCE